MRCYIPLTNAFYRAVESNDINSLRTMMKNSLLVNPSFKEFNETKKATAGVKCLWDEHDGKEFITDKSKWNNDYMAKVMVDLVMHNFSHERMNHAKEVVRYLHPTDKNGNKYDDTKNNDDKKEPERNVRENVPSKYYKAGESVNTNRLQSVINTCNKMMSSL